MALTYISISNPVTEHGDFKLPIFILSYNVYHRFDAFMECLKKLKPTFGSLWPVPKGATQHFFKSKLSSSKMTPNSGGGK